MSIKNQSEKSFMPYVTPDISFDNTKRLECDAQGNVKKVIDLAIEERGKTDYWLIAAKRLLLVLFAASFLLECFRLFIVFTPGKWKLEFMRPIVMGSLLEKSKPTTDGYEDINEYLTYLEYPSKMAEYERKFDSYKKYTEKNSLLYRSQAEVRKALGEPNPHGFKEPDLSEYGFTDELDLSYMGGGIVENPYTKESYYAYTKDGEVYWISVIYVNDYALYIFSTHN